MNRRTLWVLLALALGLFGVAYWQRGQEPVVVQQWERELLPGFDPGRARKIRIDRLRVNKQITLTRDASGRWNITDPIEYPAEQGFVHGLLEFARHNRGRPVSDPDLEKLALDPPRSVIEITEDRDGAAVTHRVELGELDIDGQSVHVRVDGVVMRTSRNIDTTIARELAEWRSHSILAVSPHAIIEVRRRGSVALDPGDPPVDLELEVALDGTGWRAHAPWRAALDVARMSWFVQAGSRINMEALASSNPEDLSGFGLSPPELEIDLVTGTEEVHTLRFGRGQVDGAWYCQRAGAPEIFRIAGELMHILAASPELLLDHRFLRFPRDEIEGLLLQAGGRETRLRRRGVLWEVAEVPQGAEETTWHVADRGAVEDVIAVLEKTEFRLALFDVEMPHTFVPQGLYVESRGELHGGVLGSEMKTAEGAKGFQFQRRGDDVVYLVDPVLFDIARKKLDELVSLHVVQGEEWEYLSFRIERQSDGVLRRYERDKDGLWRLEGTRQEALEFAALVDSLLNIRGEELIPGDPRADLDGSFRIVRGDLRGEDTAYRIGRLTAEEGDLAGEVVCQAGGLCVRIPVERLERLAGLFE